MRFCPWYPLADGAAHAPPTPGVFQIRIPSGLIDYPTGKSAMIHYQAAADVRAAVAAFAAAHPGAGWLCRHTIEMTAREVDDVEALCDKLVHDFRARFGRAPTVPT